MLYILVSLLMYQKLISRVQSILIANNADLEPVTFIV